MHWITDSWLPSAMGWAGVAMITALFYRQRTWSKVVVGLCGYALVIGSSHLHGVQHGLHMNIRAEVRTYLDQRLREEIRKRAPDEDEGEDSI